MNKILFFILLTLGAQAQANITLLDKDDWKFLFGGFIEADIFYDNTRSFTEVVGNNPVQRPNTAPGDNGRTQFSMRNSRFAFTVLPPMTNDYKPKGYFEFDFLGYDPNAGTTAPTNSESSMYTSPTLRIRHAYFSVEKNDWLLLVGQTWTLFGWDPSYVLTTISVAPVSGTVYERTPQIMALKKMSLSDDTKLLGGVSLERPVQRDSDFPNLNGGLKLSFQNRRSGFSSPSSDITAEPMSIALSGTFRQFITANPSGGTADTIRTYGGGLALNTLIPIIASPDQKTTANTLTVTGEFTAGSGYGDVFNGWSGNIPQLPTGAAGTTSANTNLDPGLGGFDTSGNFQLAKLQTWNVQGQYHLPENWKSFITGGYGQLLNTNATTFTPTGTNVLYDRSDVYFINYFHDFSQAIRLALEFDRFSSHYVDGVFALDSRFQVSAWFRF
jgi:hypothetical protein